MHRLTFAAPRRISISTGQESYTTHPWTKQAVKDYKANAGGWFCKGRHDFADLAAAVAAGVEEAA